ncbi:hypothetical protein RXV86_10390 [Alisedimentitalea sp. MJ-SS2]|uniref:hypothetical protein n=1 Tax=Aliisedimentitalea sp. MJ-SS2 TaxID=3049795 RepID=UPI00290C6E00|nr:hypothetical protein [Alisedimentitalea sp. MJ-SS2]MDU8927791.1 hypothetical protein [Alisedimentitalea sp. MJ-SS2]
MDWLQLAAPFVAVGFGVVVYKLQKAEDRRHEALLERRKTYCEFIDATSRFGHDKLYDESERNMLKVEVFRIYQHVLLTSPKPVVEAAKLFVQSLLHTRGESTSASKELEKEGGDIIWKKRRALISEMRRDLALEAKALPDFPLEEKERQDQ